MVKMEKHYDANVKAATDRIGQLSRTYVIAYLAGDSKTCANLQMEAHEQLDIAYANLRNLTDEIKKEL